MKNLTDIRPDLIPESEQFHHVTGAIDGTAHVWYHRWHRIHVTGAIDGTAQT